MITCGSPQITCIIADAASTERRLAHPKTQAPYPKNLSFVAIYRHSLILQGNSIKCYTPDTNLCGWITPLPQPPILAPSVGPDVARVVIALGINGAIQTRVIVAGAPSLVAVALHAIASSFGSRWPLGAVKIPALNRRIQGPNSRIQGPRFRIQGSGIGLKVDGEC